MRTPWICGSILLLAPLLLSVRAQDPAVVPAKLVQPSGLAQMTPEQQVCYRAAHRGMEWLRRANRQDGKFVYGFLPALRLPLDEDHYTSQAGAAYALARAGRYFGDEPAIAIARQSLLTLLLETAVDSKEPHVRYTAAPPQLLNRLASHGALVLAIHELPAPGKDLLDQTDQLCNYLRKQQQADGSLLLTEAGEDAKSARSETALQCAGLALHGLVRSQQHRPAPWKLELLAKARAYYHLQWQQQRSIPLATSHTPAYAEAYRLTKDRTYADLVFTMNDWLCALQYRDGVQVRDAWVGGFQPWSGGKAVSAPPDIRTAVAAESLADACRVARAAGDVERLRRYHEALENSLRFLLTLQYNEAKTQHYVEAFRPALLGAFHGSHTDGNLRIDHTQHALSALVRYLEHASP